MVKNRKKLRVCLVASAGGHLSQLLKLADSWKGYETFCVTTTDVVREKLQKYGKVYVVGECNREHPFQVILVFFKCIKIILSKKPNVIISTGAAPGYLLCLAGKLFGAKIIWIDSIANIDRLSLSGRLILPLSDLILSQWPEVAKKYKHVEYAGTLI